MLIDKKLMRPRAVHFNGQPSHIKKICVVLDQSTVIFQKKGGGITICVVLDQNHGNVMFYQLVSNLQSMFPSLQYTVFYGLSGIQPGF
jgi:hypothetical protein